MKRRHYRRSGRRGRPGPDGLRGRLAEGGGGYGHRRRRGQIGELTEVTVGVIPIVDTAAIWLGEEQGFFEEEGIDLDIQTTSGGAAAVPGVVSGDFDFAFGNTLSVMVAQGEGLDLEYVANGTTTSGDTERDFGAVVVPADSDIQGPEGPGRQDGVGEQPQQHRRHDDPPVVERPAGTRRASTSWRSASRTPRPRWTAARWTRPGSSTRSSPRSSTRAPARCPTTSWS